MAGFLYYLPGLRTAKPADITAHRLDYAIERKVIQPVLAGPWDGPGVIVADERSVELHALKYRPTLQTWRPCQRADGEPRVWVGWYTDEPPTAAELVRDPMLAGVDVTLPDGDRYHVPTARRWDEFDGRLLWSCALPQSLSRDANGVWVPRGPVAKYARLWDLLAGFVTARELAIAQAADGATVLFDYPAINELAIGVLGINYRIGADELEARGLWTQAVRDAVIRAALDDATREAWIKKKMVESVHAGGRFSPGLDRSMPGGPTATDPPSPICTVTRPGSTVEALT